MMSILLITDVDQVLACKVHCTELWCVQKRKNKTVDKKTNMILVNIVFISISIIVIIIIVVMMITTYNH